MVKVDFLITNPNHHLQMVIPIIKALKRHSGIKSRILSLCEFRRMETPVTYLEDQGIDYKILPGFNKTGLKPSSGQKTLGGAQNWKRKAVNALIWKFFLKTSFLKTIEKTHAVFLLNDTAYPANYVCKELNKKGIPFFMLQEGIRFPLPSEKINTHKYGTQGAKALFAWGKFSKEYFESIQNARSQTKILIGGCPRYDEIKKIDFSSQSHELRLKHGNANYILGLFSNPIDDQGFCSTKEKLILAERFIRSALPKITSVKGAVWIKLHPRENEKDFETMIARNGWSDQVKLVRGDVFKIINAVNSAVVLASTVGLEALMFAKPLAVLKIPGHGFVFDYVKKGNVTGFNLEAEELTSQIEQFLNKDKLSADEVFYLQNHLGNIGYSANFIADSIAHSMIKEYA